MGLEFQLEFHVQTSYWHTYEDFIVSLRDRLGRGQRYSHQRPILPTEDTGNIRWFDIVLRTSTNAITVRIRLNNLYLVGYRGGNPQRWYELEDSNIIPDSTPLRFGGSYTDLSRAANQALVGVTLGQESLRAAVTQLATGTATDNQFVQNTARSLIVVIQMFCESTRFTTISTHLTSTFRGSPIPRWMVDLVHSWEFLSAALLRADANPNQTFRIPPNRLRLPPNNTEVRRVVEALLTDKDWWTADDEISNGEISWNVFDTTNVYDRPLSGNISGENGSMTVNYIVLSDAVAASVKVELINGDNENTANVYGELTATNGNFGDSKIVLFQQSSLLRIDLNPGQLIPLSRSMIAVPLNSSLIVTAKLYDHDVISSDDEIANGSAEFPAQLSVTSEKSIYGKDGEIRVTVTWIFDI